MVRLVTEMSFSRLEIVINIIKMIARGISKSQSLILWNRAIRTMSSQVKNRTIDDVPSLKEFIKGNSEQAEIDDSVEMGGEHMK